jgi:acyl-coenzyme A synthetase/AMP-(fatty) acid ligase
VPKCITHGAGGTLIQHLKELALHTNLRRSDRICYFTTCGWMMWNWLVSSLGVGATIVLYEGSPFHPGAEAMFDLIDDCGVTVFGTGAKAIAAWQKAGLKPRETHQLNSLVSMLSTASPLAAARELRIRLSRDQAEPLPVVDFRRHRHRFLLRAGLPDPSGLPRRTAVRRPGNGRRDPA